MFLYGQLIYQSTSKAKRKPAFKKQQKALGNIYGNNRGYPSHELFEASKIRAVDEVFCFELINLSLRELRSKTPTSFLNKMYGTTESPLPTSNSQNGHLTTLKCTNKYQRRHCKIRNQEPNKLTAHDEQSLWKTFLKIDLLLLNVACVLLFYA